jgi:hypothetical protein
LAVVIQIDLFYFTFSSRFHLLMND